MIEVFYFSEDLETDSLWVAYGDYGPKCPTWCMWIVPGTVTDY